MGSWNPRRGWRRRQPSTAGGHALLRAANRLVDALDLEQAAGAVFDAPLRKALGLSVRDVADAIAGTRWALAETPLGAR